MAASVYLSLLNPIVRKFHHSEGGVSASSDAPEIQIVSLVHGVRQGYQFTALCFGLSAAPQVFARVMTPGSEFIHGLGFGFGLIGTAGYSGILP